MQSMLNEMILSQLPEEVLRDVAEQTGFPADWRQWPPDLQKQVAQMVLKAQQGDGD